MPDAGLSEADATERLARDGPNELPTSRPRGIWRIALDVVREPMFLLLIASGTIYLLLGDLEEALALQGAVFLVIGITLYQEQKTERALQAPRDLSSPRALVVRDGATRRIAGREVVRGDLLVLREGDRVAADATVRSSSNLSVDESLLTGESVAVRKRPGSETAPASAPGGDDQPFVYSGTLVVAGHGTARVHATGVQTELGKIGKSLAGLDVGRTALQREVDRVVRILAWLGFASCLVVSVVYGLARAHWLDGALAGLTLAISMVPEEFPVILTVFLALGAWRISRSQVLTRRMPAIETLGSATELCVDKTGTLTLNRMSVAAIVADGRRHVVGAGDRELPSPFADVIRTAILASATDPFDPMERAFVDLAQRIALPNDHDGWSLRREYPLADRLLAVTRVWQRPNADSYVVAAKGAPEAIVGLSGLTGSDAQRVVDEVNAMAGDGLRVLGVARADWRGDALPDAATGFRFELLGLVGLADPVRPAVPAAIDECRAAHVRVVMITGDYPSTALQIAQQIGMTKTGGCLTGPEIAGLDDRDLQRRVADVDVFARVVPEQKLRLVRALQANGDVVAMTGDGVNDAPALKAAHIGIAMGQRGTDVAREAAALVLLDDDFASIVRAIRLGRRIYDNIQKATAYVLAIHVPIAGVSAVPVLLAYPLILMPVHVIFLELIVDPACSIAFEMEPEEGDVMNRPPRRPDTRLFATALVLPSVLQGLGALAASVGVFIVAIASKMTEPDVRTLSFSTLIVTNLLLILVNRSRTRSVLEDWRTPNPALRWLVGGALAVLAAILYVTPLRDLFRLGMPHPGDALVIAGAGMAALVWMELVKRLSAHRPSFSNR